MRLRTSLLLLMICLAVSCLTARHNTSAHEAASLSAADRVIATYYRILNAGLQNGDFSALPQVYAPDATLKHSTLQGNAAIYHGLAQISTYYHTAYIDVPGAVFKTVSIRDLTPDIVLTYDNAFFKTGSKPGRCAHVFVLQHGKIVTHDWINYQAAGR